MLGRLLSFSLFCVLLAGGWFLWLPQSVMGSERLDEVRQRVEPTLKQQLALSGFALGDPLYIRIFKENNDLEIWLLPKDKPVFQLFKTYPIACYSGRLGPKLMEGDFQAPEGFYTVKASQMNPRSRFHLAFNIGYPNDYDCALCRSGSDIMVHGSNISIGCFAMSDPLIEEIYLLADAALQNGQEDFPVHSFPFRMTEERLEREGDNEWLSFWNDLRIGYEIFEQTRIPPEVSVQGNSYVIAKPKG
jgi:murein L,D-transpeptidase YafK